MALRDRLVPIRFQTGIDTESDDKTLEPGTPTEVRNGVFTKRVTIEKRFGTRELSRRRITSDGAYGIVSGSVGLATRADGGELLGLSTTDELMSWDDVDESWVDRGDWVPVRHDVIGLPRGTNERWDGTTAVIGNVRL